MNKVKRFLQYGQQGFTLIELLIVIAVLGALAGVVAPNVTNMMGSANIAAANTEVANVKTASTSYLADNGAYPSSSDNLTSGSTQYLSGTAKAKYAFHADSGNITGVTSSQWGTITFDVPHQKWQK